MTLTIFGELNQFIYFIIYDTFLKKLKNNYLKSLYFVPETGSGSQGSRQPISGPDLWLNLSFCRRFRLPRNFENLQSPKLYENNYVTYFYENY